MTDRQDWEQAAAGSRHLAIAADAKLRRRHPGQKLEPLRSTEPVPVTDVERDGKFAESSAWIHDLAAQHHAFREKLTERQHLLLPCEDLDWSAFGRSLLSWWMPRHEAVLQPPNLRSAHRPRFSSSPPNTTSNPRLQANHIPPLSALPEVSRALVVHHCHRCYLPRRHSGMAR